MTLSFQDGKKALETDNWETGHKTSRFEQEDTQQGPAVPGTALWAADISICQQLLVLDWNAFIELQFY